MLTLAAWLISLPFLLVLGTFLAETLTGIRRPTRSRGAPGAGKNARVCIIMPAHNEAAGIGHSLAALMPQLSPHVTLLVVADNCSDETAAVAREAGADVVERNDPDRRGKGYALDFARAHLASAPPEAVIILDADCAMEPGSIDALAAVAAGEHKPAQACNLIKADLEAGPMVQISNLAFLIKNLVRQRGMARLGGPALLTGTGMALPWAQFASADIASDNIVEDLALGVTLTRHGHTPVFVEAASVSSAAASEGDTLVQRTRWEHGFVQTAVRQAFPLVAQGLTGLSRPLLLLGLHLLVPPLALLFPLAVGCAVLLALLWLAGASAMPLLVMAGMIGLAVFAVALAWHVNGRAMASAATLARIPGYVLWKIPVYLKLVKRGETEWVRTRRPGEDSPGRKG